MDSGTSLFEHRGLDEEQKKRVDHVKGKAAELFQAIEDNLKSGREKSLAITNLEQSVMWAAKAVSREAK